jgi:hypothetical protein
MVRTVAALAALLLTGNVESEMVEVKDFGPVDLMTFECRDTPRSTVVQRVCYDLGRSYMIINVKGAYYRYCELPPATFNELMAAPSMGQFYNVNISGPSSYRRFDCETYRAPKY